jgi:transposase-like protein
MRKRYTAEQREQLIAQVRAGESIPVVATRMGVGTSAAYLWVKEARGSKPVFAQLVSATATSVASLVVEVGRVRVHVVAGFDATLLREIVSALSDGA